VWAYLGNEQRKTTESFRPDRWLDESVASPRHDDTARAALAEAVAVLRHGETVRDQLVTALARQPQFSERWLRALALELRR
jgi:alkylhydroperoxidase family enzyme